MEVSPIAHIARVPSCRTEVHRCLQNRLREELEYCTLTLWRLAGFQCSNSLSVVSLRSQELGVSSPILSSTIKTRYAVPALPVQQNMSLEAIRASTHSHSTTLPTRKQKQISSTQQAQGRARNCGRSSGTKSEPRESHQFKLTLDKSHLVSAQRA